MQVCSSTKVNRACTGSPVSSSNSRCSWLASSVFGLGPSAVVLCHMASTRRSRSPAHICGRTALWRSAARPRRAGRA
eukprot:scaffold125044_cov63-Phaeocystis_antarctica.AAC.2